MRPPGCIQTLPAETVPPSLMLNSPVVPLASERSEPIAQIEPGPSTVAYPGSADMAIVRTVDAPTTGQDQSAVYIEPGICYSQG